jgi:hypothetical protein
MSEAGLRAFERRLDCCAAQRRLLVADRLPALEFPRREEVTGVHDEDDVLRVVAHRPREIALVRGRELVEHHVDILRGHRRRSMSLPTQGPSRASREAENPRGGGTLATKRSLLDLLPAFRLR